MIAKIKLVLFLAFVLLSPVVLFGGIMRVTHLMLDSYTGFWLWVLGAAIGIYTSLLGVADAVHRHEFNCGLLKVIQSYVDGRLLAYFEGKRSNKKKDKGG